MEKLSFVSRRVTEEEYAQYKYEIERSFRIRIAEAMFDKILERGGRQVVKIDARWSLVPANRQYGMYVDREMEWEYAICIDLDSAEDS